MTLASSSLPPFNMLTSLKMRGMTASPFPVFFPSMTQMSSRTAGMSILTNESERGKSMPFRASASASGSFRIWMSRTLKTATSVSSCTPALRITLSARAPSSSLSLSWTLCGLNLSWGDSPSTNFLSSSMEGAHLPSSPQSTDTCLIRMPQC